MSPGKPPAPCKRVQLGIVRPVRRSGGRGVSAEMSGCLFRQVLMPGPDAWPPGRDGAPVRLVLLAELAGQGRLLVPPDERGDGYPNRGGVTHPDPLAPRHALPRD